MSIVAVREKKRSAKKVLEKSLREYTRVFEVESDITTEAAGVIIAAIPAVVGGFYPTDSGAACIGIEADQVEENLNCWSVTANYSSAYPDPAKQDENPLLRPAVWKFGTRTISEAIEKDLEDQDIANSAFDPHLPPIEIERHIPVVNVTINHTLFVFAYVMEVIGSINSDVWFGFPVRTVKVTGLDVSEKTENNINYYEYNWTLEIEKNEWTLLVLDRGFNVLTGAGNKHVTDDHGNPSPNQVLLDGTGQQLADGADPVYSEFFVYPERSFADIP